jgi:hypothetical protein
MKTTAILVAALAVAVAAPARADITSLGKYQLGQKYKKEKLKKATLYGCAGKLYAEPGKDKTIAKVTFETDEKCAPAQITDAITKDFGGPPIVDAGGDRLWEGTTASVIVVMEVGDTIPIVYLLPPGPGSKRTCWADDGFAAFWAGFQKALASGKPDAIAATFTFPFKVDGGDVQWKDAKALAASWKDYMDPDDAKAFISGDKKPSCSYYYQRYEIYLTAQYADVYATKVGDTWHWTSVAFESAD